MNKDSKIKADFSTNGKSEYSTELDSKNQLPEFYAKFKDRIMANGDASVIIATDSDIDITRLAEFKKQAKESGAKMLYLRQNGQNEIAVFDLKAKENSLEIYPPQNGKPNPLTLVVDLDEKGNLMFNGEKSGTIEDASQLEKKLTEVFEARKASKLFRDGTNEVETSIFIRLPKNTKLRDPNAVKLIDTVKKSEAYPIGIVVSTD